MLSLIRSYFPTSGGPEKLFYEAPVFCSKCRVVTDAPRASPSGERARKCPLCKTWHPTAAIAERKPATGAVA